MGQIFETVLHITDKQLSQLEIYYGTEPKKN